MTIECWDGAWPSGSGGPTSTAGRTWPSGWSNWQLPRAGYVCLGGEQGADYGGDLTVRTFDDRGYVENGAFHIQVKATARATRLADGVTITYGLDRRDLAHWMAESDPVILVVYDAVADAAYWTYVRRYLDRLSGFALRTAAEHVTILLYVRDIFDAAAVREIGKSNRLVQRRLTGQVRHG